MFYNTLTHQFREEVIIVDGVKLKYARANIWQTDRGKILEVFTKGDEYPEINYIATLVIKGNLVQIATYI